MIVNKFIIVLCLVFILLLLNKLIDIKKTFKIPQNKYFQQH